MKNLIVLIYLFVIFPVHISSYKYAENNIIKQEKTAWCWVAVSSATIDYKTGYRFSQCSIANTRFKNEKLNCCEKNNKVCNQPITLIELKIMLINDFGLNAYLYKDNRNTRHIVHLISTGSVIIVGIQKQTCSSVICKTYNHIVMIIGYNDTQLIVYDPEETIYNFVNYTWLTNSSFILVVN